MVYNLIKISGILIVTVCCIIATYTDVKYGIIPNKLTIPLFVVGICLVSLYYFLSSTFNFFYYVSIVIIFLLNYILWYLGLWAGGDVKLFTAISTLLVPEFLSIIPNMEFNVILFNLTIPTLDLMINSIFSVIPLIMCYCIYIILKKKRYLLRQLYCVDDFYRSVFRLNLMIIGYSIIFTDSFLIKIIFITCFVVVCNRLFYKWYFILLSCVVIFSLGIDSVVYLSEFIIFNVLVIVNNIFRLNIISSCLTSIVDVNDLCEGMILSCCLCKCRNTYFFSDNGFRNRIRYFTSKDYRESVVISTKVCGLTSADIYDIHIFSNKMGIYNIPIKKTLPFAPFILGGLLLTYLCGNILKITSYLMEMI